MLVSLGGKNNGLLLNQRAITTNIVVLLPAVLFRFIISEMFGIMT